VLGFGGGKEKGGFDMTPVYSGVITFSASGRESGSENGNLALLMHT
jgi:hypothetical protein